jgi:transposase
MRQTHVGGDKLFVDYAGDTVPVIIDRLTGEVRRAQVFVAVMGASNFTYVEAAWTQGLEPLDAAARHDLLDILEERYGRRSTIITSQIPVDNGTT